MFRVSSGGGLQLRARPGPGHKQGVCQPMFQSLLPRERKSGLREQLGGCCQMDGVWCRT